MRCGGQGGRLRARRGAGRDRPLEEGCDTFSSPMRRREFSARGARRRPDIYVLNGIPPGAEDECAAAGLTPVANSAEQLAAWRAAAQRLGQRLPVGVQVDSGMSRLGMPPAEVEDAPVAVALDGLNLKLVMSHLACADEPDNPVNEAQRSSVRDAARESCRPRPRRSPIRPASSWAAHSTTISRGRALRSTA